MLDFILNNSITLLFGLVVLVHVLQWLNEYFPIKPRYSEDIMERYLEYQLYRRYQCRTSKYLKNLNLRTRL